MGRRFGYMVTGFIFTERRVSKVVIKKLASEMTKTQAHSTMVYCGRPCPYVKSLFASFGPYALFNLFLKDWTLSDRLVSTERLFHSRIVLGKNDSEKISLRIKGTRSGRMVSS